MKPVSGHWLVPACVLALAACAEKPHEVSTPRVSDAQGTGDRPQSPAKPQADPDFKKPVRMNGRGEVSSISLEKFFELQQSGSALIYDARPGFFYSLGHIPGAISLPRNGGDATIARHEAEIKAALAAGKTIVVYCTSVTCPDARTVARHISGFGYPSTIFTGGWDAWKDAGMPTD